MDAFTLHPRLAADTLPVGRLPLSLLVLMNDATYPWVILVPQRPAVRELFELGEEDRRQLMEEIASVSRVIAEAFVVDKLNVAALGNVVEQLHVHVVGRTRDDPAWPGPVWGRGELRAYAADELAATRAALIGRLAPTLRPIGSSP